MTAATFTEEWFCEASRARLAELARQVSNVPGLVVEIGSWEGRSTVALANAVNPRMVQAVDTWAGSPGEVSEVLARGRDVFGQWCTNINALTVGNVVAHRMGWREYVASVHEPVALLFVDAEHTYTEVFDTVTAFLPKMAPGGVICGDDVGHPPVRRAVADTLGADNVWVQATVWSWTR